MAPRRTFTVKEKVDIISRLQNGENNTDLCKEFKVSHSTISTMWKNRAKILECFGSKSLKIKKNRKSTHQDIENALLVWCRVHRSQNLPLTGRLLQEQANHFAKLIGKTNFVCSESWIYRFRQRHDIVLGKASVEAPSVSQSEVNEMIIPVVPTFPTPDEDESKEEVEKEEEEEQEPEPEQEQENCNVDEIPTTMDALCAVTILKRYCLFGEGKGNIDIEAVMKMEYTLLCTLAQNSKLKQYNFAQFFKNESE